MGSVWISGAGGFIGRHLARALKAQGELVSGLGHGPWLEHERQHVGISTWIKGDVSLSNLEQLMGLAGKPETIFHLAGGSSVAHAIGNPHDDFSRTVDSIAELLEWVRLRSPSTRIVAVSSAAVYGSGHMAPISEHARVSPISPYGVHKLMMEQACKSYAETYGLNIIMPRLFSVYGPGLRKQLLWDLCQKLLSQPTVELGGTGDELRDWTDIRDIVRILARMAELASPRAPSINLATGMATPVKEVAHLVLEQWGRNDLGSAVRFNGKSRAGDPISLVADTQLLSTFGFETRILVAQGIIEYVTWFRSLAGSAL